MGAPYKLLTTETVLPAGCIVEIGSERGQGSTAYLRTLADQRKRDFYSLDLRTDHTLAEEVLLGVTASQKIAWTYFDGADWTWDATHPAVAEQRAWYAERGIVLTNAWSQASHYAQALCVHRLSVPGSLCVFDDTWWDGEAYDGKGGLAVPYLLSRHWEVVSRTALDPVTYEGHVQLRRGHG